MLPPLGALPGAIRGPRRPQQRSSRGETFYHIPIVQKDSSLRGSGPKCRLKPSWRLSSLHSLPYREVCLCVWNVWAHVLVECMLLCEYMCLK